MRMVQDGVDVYCLPDDAYCAADDGRRSPLDIDGCPIGCEVCGGGCYYYHEGWGKMTENEAKSIKWMKCVRDDAVVALDNIAKNEPNVSPMLYAGRKEKAETIIKGFEELEQYRTIGTVEEIEGLNFSSNQLRLVNLVEEYKKMLKEYEAIGTVEECREAREKQRGIKTGEPYINGYGNKKAECLKCHCTVMYPTNYCKFCGQKLDWSDTN